MGFYSLVAFLLKLKSVILLSTLHVLRKERKIDRKIYIESKKRERERERERNRNREVNRDIMRKRENNFCLNYLTSKKSRNFAIQYLFD